MKPDVTLYDTTLRDGAQAEGINFSTADKLHIAERLDLFGVHYIEGGWPGSNPKDIEFFERAKSLKFTHARLAAFGSTRRQGVRVEDDPQVRTLLEADTPVVTIFGKTWLLHVHEVLRTTPEENLAMIEQTVAYLKAAGRLRAGLPAGGAQGGGRCLGALRYERRLAARLCRRGDPAGGGGGGRGDRHPHP